MTWPNAFRNSQEICGDWGVTSFPTIYVIDADGRIRYRDERGDELERVVGELVAELVKER